MGVPLKTEQRRRHTSMASSRPWVRRAEGYRGTRQVIPSWQVPATPRRPPSLVLSRGDQETQEERHKGFQEKSHLHPLMPLPFH
jgi:hypothetical protein